MKRILALCLTLVLLTGMLPAPQAEADNLTLTVKGGWLRLRDEASYSGDTIASYYTGTRVTVLDTRGAWYYVRTPDGRVGYMLGSYLTSSGTGSSGSALQSITAYVTSKNGKGVRLRHGPGTSYGVIRQYAVGTKVTILSSGTYWHYISVDGQKGYMMADYLTTSQVDPTPTPDPTPDVDVSYTAYVTSENGKAVRMRKGAGKSYGVVASFAVGTEVLVHGTSGSWSQITASGQQGYMMSKYLTTVKPGTSEPVDPDPSEPGFVSYTAYVVSDNGKGVRWRKGPSTSQAVIGTLDLGTKVTVLAKSGKWSYIEFMGSRGYMMSEFLAARIITEEGTPAPDTYTAYVTSENGKGVYLRKGAGTSYSAWGLYSVGTQVTVLQHGVTWDRVRIGSREGYMMNKFLTTTMPGSKTVSGVMLSNALPAVGETLWANVTPVDANVTYEWMTDNGLLLATTASLTLKADDVGLRIRVRVTGVNGYTGSAVSAFATVQKKETQDKPFSGTASLNFSAIMPGVTLKPSVNVNCEQITYHWYVNGTEVANTSSFKVLPEMAGKEIKLVVKPAVGSGYAGQVESNICTVLSTNITTPTDL